MTFCVSFRAFRSILRVDSGLLFELTELFNSQRTLLMSAVSSSNAAECRCAEIRPLQADDERRNVMTQARHFVLMYWRRGA